MQQTSGFMANSPRGEGNNSDTILPAMSDNGIGRSRPAMSIQSGWEIPNLRFMFNAFMTVPASTRPPIIPACTSRQRPAISAATPPPTKAAPCQPNRTAKTRDRKRFDECLHRFLVLLHSLHLLHERLVLIA